MEADFTDGEFSEGVGLRLVWVFINKEVFNGLKGLWVDKTLN